MEFLNLAIKIRSNVINMVMNEKYVAKRWRPIITFPMADAAHGLMRNIRTANSINPIKANDGSVNSSEYNIRLQAQDAAIANCETIIDLLQFMVDARPAIINKLAPFAEDAVKEIALLRGWRLSDSKRYK